MKASRQAPIRRGGAPAWMVTFADLMALMLTFFVLMLALAEIDAKKYEEAMMSIQDAFGRVWHRDIVFGEQTGQIVGERVDITVPPPKPQPEVVEVKKEQPDHTAQLYQQINQILEHEIAQNLIELERQHGNIVIRFEESISFPSASAELQSLFVPVLNKISGSLEMAQRNIIVVGHTDDRPISTERFRSNWDLSSARAASVVHHLLKNSTLKSDTVIAQGRADTQPLVPNNSTQNRARNRRVEILVIGENGNKESTSE